MAVVVFDRRVGKALIRERAAPKANHHDEVWNGVYIVSPDPDIEHFDVSGELIHVIKLALPDPKLVRVHGGGNITDREDDWTKNYRCPDLCVFFPDNPARHMGTHWIGGPDFAVEILSPNDRARKKFGFYAKVGVRELLLIGRKPWLLELYRLAYGELKLIGKSSPKSPDSLVSQVLPISFRLIAGNPRPDIEVTQTEDARQWLI
jgi:Uma2 family endonuclease